MGKSTRLKAVALNTGWLVGKNIYTMALSVVIASLSARYLGPSNYGWINYAASYVSFFTALSRLGLDSFIVYDLTQRSEQTPEIIGTALVLRIICSSLSVIAVTAIVALSESGNQTLIIIAFLLALALLFDTYEVFSYWFSAKLLAKYVSIATMIACTVMGIWRIVLLIRGATVVWFAASSAISAMVSMIFVTICFFARNRSCKLRFSFDMAKSLLRRSYHFVLGSFAIAIFGNVDKIMLRLFIDEVHVGYYAAAMTIAAIWEFVPKAIISSCGPTIYELKKQGNPEYLRRIQQLFVIVMSLGVLVGIAFMVFSRLAIQVLYGDDFLPATVPLMILIWSTSFSQVGNIRAIWAMTESKYQYSKYFMILGAVLNITLNAIMIPLWGMNGAAIATCITIIFVALGAPMCFSKTRPFVYLMLSAHHQFPIVLRYGLRVLAKDKKRYSKDE